jgi:hypothetical protein
MKLLQPAGSNFGYEDITILQSQHNLIPFLGQGRGQQTHAFTHALETSHHMFMKLSDGRVYCLPEGYEVDDPSLDAIRYVLNPTFTTEKVTYCLHPGVYVTAAYH